MLPHVTISPCVCVCVCACVWVSECACVRLHSVRCGMTYIHIRDICYGSWLRKPPRRPAWWTSPITRISEQPGHMTDRFHHSRFLHYGALTLCQRQNMKSVLTYVMHFFLNNQPDAIIIPISFCYKTLRFGHLLCPSSADLYCTFCSDKFHASFWWPFPSKVRMERSSILTLLGNGHQKPAWNLPEQNVQ